MGWVTCVHHHLLVIQRDVRKRLWQEREGEGLVTGEQSLEDDEDLSCQARGHRLPLTPELVNN